MRIQVAVESRRGCCEHKDCVITEFLVLTKQMTVFLGNSFEKSPWLCSDHYDIFEKEGPSFDVEQEKIDMKGPPTRRIRNTSRKRELEIAEKIGGRRQPGSGNTPFMKGDVRKKGVFRGEMKECFGVEFGVHRINLLDKIRSECSKGEYPVVVVTFRDKSTHQELDSWAMVPFDTWEKYVNGTD